MEGAVAETLGTPAAFFAGAALSLLTIAIVAFGLRWARDRGSLGVTTIDSGGSGRAVERPPARSASATR